MRTRSRAPPISPSPGPLPLSSNPLSPEAAKQLYDDALAQITAQRGELALPFTRRLLAGLPDWPGSHAIHGEALLSTAEYEGALAEFEWILARLPADPLALLKRGFALSALGRFDDARASFDAARSADRAFVDGFCRSLAEGAEEPAELGPENIFLWRRFLAQREADWRDWDRYIEVFRRAIADPSVRLERGLMHAAFHLPLDASERHALARKIALGIEARVAPLPPRAPAPSDRPLRIGVLSSGFREHIDALLWLPFFELADRKRFELYAYSLAPDDRSAARDAIRRNSHAFRDLSAFRAADCAQQIRRDEIDILVDGVGHAEGGRFEIVAARPAPLQVLYLGYVCTLGSSRVDYAILDPLIAPIEEAQHWSERLAHLPDTYFLYDWRSRPKPVAVSRRDYGLPEGRPVLCAFHKAEKIDPETFALWMRILAARAEAVLWLLADSDRAAANLRGAARNAGVDPSRLVFAGREPHERYLARLALADFFVDALQHNAIVTACDCLAAGLPVLTVSGPTLTSRAAGSLLRAANLPELVAGNPEQYVRRAIQLIDGGAVMARQKLERERTRAPLFDTAGQVRALEATFTEMWRKYLAGQAPASFSVSRNRT